MTSAFWEQVVADGRQVPADRPLDEMTAELTRMLGDPDPHLRDEIAYPTLATWVGEGVYDDLLAGFGDGMCAGLRTGLGESGTDTVFRRSFSALLVTECIDRDAERGLVPVDVVLGWGDRVAGWFLRERDLRGFVPGKGWAHAVAHGADAVGALARHPRLGGLELTVLLDVLADRLLEPTEELWVCGETDRMALATMHVLRRNVLGLDVLEPWVNRIATAATPRGDARHNAFLVAGNAQGYLRSLHLQLALAPQHPEVRADLLLVLIDQLRRTNADYLVAGAPPS